MAAEEEVLSQLYAEFSDEDEKLAEVGLTEYAALLEIEEREDGQLPHLLETLTEELQRQLGSDEEIAIMATKAVTAEAFWMAFQALSRPEQKAVVERLLQDGDFTEDLVDIALIEERRDEPSRPLREYLAERQHQGRT